MIDQTTWRKSLKQQATKLLASLLEQARHGYVSPIEVATLYTRLGEREQALVWLEKAYAERHGELIGLKVEPVFDNLRTDPRFIDLLRRVGLML